MKTIPLLLIIVSFALGQRPAPPKNRQVLLDFRVERGLNPPKISAATERYVLSKMFRRYLRDANKCNPQFAASSGSDPLAAARKAGEIVPSISDVATGRFTAAGQSQTLYVVSVGECNASHADSFGTKRVAIFSGQQLIAEFDVDFYQSIARKTDLNGDGIDELLMTRGYMGQGELTESAALLSFQNGRLRVVHDFSSVLQDTCASLRPGSYSKASVLYFTGARPDGMPKLSVETYQAGCNGARRWRLISRGPLQ